MLSSMIIGDVQYWEISPAAKASYRVARLSCVTTKQVNKHYTFLKYENNDEGIAIEL